MLRPLIASLLVAFVTPSQAENFGRAGHVFLTAFNGSTIKASRSMELRLTKFEQCKPFLKKVEMLHPNDTMVTESCGPYIPPPPGYQPQPEAPPEYPFVDYKDPRIPEAVSIRVTYLFRPDQTSSPTLCRELIAAFHSNHINVKCTEPSHPRPSK